MATTHIAPLIERRLKELNKKIDSKILRGKPYQSEAREHRALLARLRGFRTRSFFSHSLAFLHLL